MSTLATVESSMPPKKKHKNKKDKPEKLTAKTADRHALYEEAVQSPEADIKFLDRVYKKAYGRLPVTFREDFCGTAALSCEWVRKRPENTAVGVDLDEEVVAYGLNKHVAALGDDRHRVSLVLSDVLQYRGAKVDAVASLNFSYFIFKERATMVRYFRSVRESLNDEGVFLMDIMGGPEAQIVQEEEREQEGFTYVWDQDVFNPITHDFQCHIHFTFPNKSKLKRAFSYDWRLWTIPELKDILLEVGFESVDVYWEGADEDGEGDGIFRKSKEGDDAEAWIAYVVAKP